VHRYPAEEFLWGLAAGMVAMLLAVGVLAVAGRLCSRGGPLLVTGLPTAAAALVAIGPSRAPTPGVFVGLVGVTAASTVATWRAAWRGRIVMTVLVASVFAWLLAIDASSIAWVRAVVVAGATVGPLAAARTDAGWGPTGVTPALYAISAAGVFAAVPNTREAAALLGASLPGAVCGWPLGPARLGRAGGAGATALLVWVSAVGALGREPSVVGAVACLGLLAALPAGRWLAGRWIDPSLGLRRRVADGAVPLLVVHTAVVAVASRVAGISSELRVAIPVALAAIVSALIASTWLQPDSLAPHYDCGDR
jgi:hypothetical protein